MSVFVQSGSEVKHGMYSAQSVRHVVHIAQGQQNGRKSCGPTHMKQAEHSAQVSPQVWAAAEQQAGPSGVGGGGSGAALGGYGG